MSSDFLKNWLPAEGRPAGRPSGEGSHQRRKDPENAPIELEQNVEVLEAAQGDGLTHLQGFLEVPADVLDTGGLAQPDTVFKVEEQAAVVQIDGAHGGKAVIHHKVFGVNKAGGVLINLDAGA